MSISVVSIGKSKQLRSPAPSARAPLPVLPLEVGPSQYDVPVMSKSDACWMSEVRPEWTGHTWRSSEVAAAQALVAEARVWAEDPAGVLYIHSESIRRAYAVAVAVSQRAAQTMCEKGVLPDGVLAAGCLDELSVPEDPDPDYTAKSQQTEPLWSALDTVSHHSWLYSQRLATAPLTLLRLREEGDEGMVLDRVADHRHNHMLPTVSAGVVPPALMAERYGGRVAWRLGFANSDGTQIGMSTPDAAVLDVDHPPA